MIGFEQPENILESQNDCKTVVEQTNTLVPDTNGFIVQTPGSNSNMHDE